MTEKSSLPLDWNIIRSEWLRRKLEGSLLDYTKYYFEEFKKQEFSVNWHHKVISQCLQDVFYGKLRFVIINVPPRHTKTELAVKAFISWSLGKNPRCKFIHLSYSEMLALDNSREVRDIVQSDCFRKVWNIDISHDTKAKKLWNTTAGGGVYSTSTGGQITGFGAGGLSDNFEGCIIIDDPQKPIDVISDVKRNETNDRFNNTIKSRMNNPSKTPIVIISQRLHEDDLCGFLLNGGSEFDFEHVCLPSVNEDGKSKYDNRERGQVLWKKKHNRAQLELMRLKDNKTYTEQYQQRPAPQEGILFKNFARYTHLPKDVIYIIQSWDFTFKKKDQSDFVVGTCWAKDSASNYYLIDRERARMTFEESKAAIRNMLTKHPLTRAAIVEDTANGPAIINSLSTSINKLIPFNPKGSKFERAQIAAPLFESGAIRIPTRENAPWVDEYISELKHFPNGKYDDQVDSTSQAIIYLEKNKIGSGLDRLNKSNKTFRNFFSE